MLKIENIVVSDVWMIKINRDGIEVEEKHLVVSPHLVQDGYWWTVSLSDSDQSNHSDFVISHSFLKGNPKIDSYQVIDKYFDHFKGKNLYAIDTKRFVSRLNLRQDASDQTQELMKLNLKFSDLKIGNVIDYGYFSSTQFGTIRKINAILKVSAIHVTHITFQVLEWNYNAENRGTFSMSRSSIDGLGTSYFIPWKKSKCSKCLD